MAMSVIIVGGGKVGSYLASLLLSEGHQVKVVEIRAEEMDRLRTDLPDRTAVLGSGTDPQVLEAVGIRQADAVAAVTGLDEVNLVVTSLARFEFSVPRIIARVNNPKNAWLFTPDMGVDAALNQADLIARLVMEEMAMGDMVTLLKLRKGQFSLVEEKVDPHSIAVGKAVRDLNLPRACTLVGVIRQGEVLVPRGDFTFQPEDQVLALVHADEAGCLPNILGPPI